MELRPSPLESLVTGSDTAICPAFWQSRRVFLTGHTGFKGSWLSLWLRLLGAEVTGYALPPPTEPSLFEAARVAKGLDSHIGDVRDADALTRALIGADPEVMIHMAAQPLVRQSYAEPVETYATNVMGTVHVLEAARRARSVRAIVIVTTDKCYANRDWLWGYREDEALGGHDPYSSSKACSELVTAAYRDAFFPPVRHAEHGVAVATARAGNVIGGGDWARDRLVPDAIQAFLAGRPVVLRHPQAVRPWQHVLEPLAGYLMLAQRLWTHGPDAAGPWNFGPGPDGERTVAEVVGALAAAWGDGAGWEGDGTTGHPREDGLLKLDSAKARHGLNWKPRWPLDRALTAVAGWYREHANGADARTLTLGQIGAYAPEISPEPVLNIGPQP